MASNSRNDVLQIFVDLERLCAQFGFANAESLLDMACGRLEEYIDLRPDILRIVARRCGLPPSITVRCVEWLCNRVESQHDNMVTRKISQTVKYSMRKLLQNSEGTDPVLLEKILDLVLIAVEKIRNPECQSQLTWALGDLVKCLPGDKSLSGILEKFTPGDNICRKAKDYLADQIRRKGVELNSVDHLFDMTLGNVNYGNVELPPSMRNRPGVSYITQTQTAVSIRSNNFESEKRDMLIIDLVEILKSKKERQEKLNPSKSAQRLPIDENIQEGSDRWWFKDTYNEIDSLLNKARSNITLRHQDVNEYLDRKLLGSHYWTWNWGGKSGTELNVDITEIIFIYSKTHKLEENVIDKLMKCLSPQLTGFTPGQLGKLRLNAIRALHNRSEKQIIFCSETEKPATLSVALITSTVASYIPWRPKEFSRLETIRQCLKCPNDWSERLEIMSWADKILENYKTESDEILLCHNSLEILCGAEDDYRNDLEDHLHRIRRQTWEPNKSEKFFTAAVVNKIIAIVVEKYDTNRGIRCAEIILDYLSFGSSSCTLSKENLNRFLILLNTQNLRSDLSNAVLQSVILGLEKDNELTQFEPCDLEEIALELCNLISLLQPPSSYYAILALRGMIDKYSIRISFKECLVQKLFNDATCVVRTENLIEFKNREDIKENTNLWCISAYIADMFLTAVKAKKYDLGILSLGIVLDCLEKNKDKQTRIAVAEIFYLCLSDLVNDEQSNEEIIGRVLDFTKDSVADVRIYTSVIYCDILSSSNIEISDEIMKDLSNFFAYDQLPLSDHDFAEEINNNIINILLKAAIAKQTFTEDIYILCNNIIRLGIQYVDIVLKTLKLIAKQGKLLPVDTLSAMENVSEKEITIDIFQLCIKNGQEVPEKIIDLLAAHLNNNEDSSKRTECFKILETADKNQDLSDSAFDILEMERAGRISFDNCDNDDSVVIVNSLNFLLGCSRNSKTLTIQNFDTFLQVIGRNDEITSLVFEILISVKENGNAIRNDVLIKAIGVLDSDPSQDILSQFCQLVLCVLKQDQTFTGKLLCKEKLEVILEMKVVECDLFCEIFSVILHIVEMESNMYLNEISAKRLIESFNNVVDRKCRSLFLPLLPSIIAKIPEHCKEILQEYYKACIICMQTKDDGLVMSAIQGLTKLSLHYQLSDSDLDFLLDFACKCHILEVNKKILTLLDPYNLSPEQQEVKECINVTEPTKDHSFHWERLKLPVQTDDTNTLTEDLLCLKTIFSSHNISTIMEGAHVLKELTVEEKTKKLITIDNIEFLMESAVEFITNKNLSMLLYDILNAIWRGENKCSLMFTTNHVTMLCQLFEKGTCKTYFKNFITFIHEKCEISDDAQKAIHLTLCFTTKELISSENLLQMENILSQGSSEFDLLKIQKFVNDVHEFVIESGDPTLLPDATMKKMLVCANCCSSLILQEEKIFSNLFTIQGDLEVSSTTKNVLEIMEFFLSNLERIKIESGNFLLGCKILLKHAALQPNHDVSCYFDVVPKILTSPHLSNSLYTSCVFQFVIGVLEASRLRMRDLQPQMITILEKFLTNENNLVQMYCFDAFRQFHLNGLQNTVFTEWCLENLQKLYNVAGLPSLSLELNSENFDILRTMCLVRGTSYETLKNVKIQSCRLELLRGAIYKKYLHVANELDQYNFSVNFGSLSNNPKFADADYVFANILESLLIAIDTGNLNAVDLKEIVVYLNYIKCDISLSIVRGHNNCIGHTLRKQAYLSVIMEKLGDPIKTLQNANKISAVIDGKITFEDTLNLLNHIDSINCVDELCKTLMFFHSSTLSLREIKLQLCQHPVDMLKMFHVMLLTENLTPAYTKLKATKTLSAIFDRGFTFDDIKSLFSPTKTVDELQQANVSDIVASILGIIYQYNLEASDSKDVDCVKKICNFVNENPQQQSLWLKKANTVVVDKIFKSGYSFEDALSSNFAGSRNLTDILKEFQSDNKEVLQTLSDNPDDNSCTGVIDAVKLKVEKIRRQKKLSIVFRNFALQDDTDLKSRQKKCLDTEFENWSTEEYQTWGKEMKENHSFYSSQEGFLEEALAVLKAAISKCYTYQLRDTQLLSCLLAMLCTERNITGINRGLLQQVVTGGGKSVIIQILAILQALKGHQVFVVTSNRVLAQRDAQQSRKLMQLFNLTVDHNQDTKIYIRGPKDCYTKNVVFGEASQFQFDILRDEYSSLRTLAGCSLDVMIVDEVDSMFIDDSSKLARLASILPGMDQLEFIYHFVWEKLHQMQSSIFCIDGRMFLAFGKLHLDCGGVLSMNLLPDENGKIINIPDLHFHIRSGYKIEGICLEIEGDVLVGISNHLNNLLRALVTEDQLTGYEMKVENKMKIPKHLQSFVEHQIPRWVENALTAFYYTENVHYIVHEGSIKPVDFDTTGVVQKSTSWSDGLQQFLQIKHNLVVTPETLATNYLSNVGFFQRFENKKLFGFTGTFGSKAAKEAISELYNVDLILIPNSNRKRYFKYSDEIVNSKKEWILAIKDSVNLELKQHRAVLIICRTIRDAEIIHKEISESTKRSNSVKLYTKDLTDEDKHVERVAAGEVIVATNLAGRGTDIKTESIIEENGGLHVIMTFLPASQRAEDQAIGRTSRINNVGTSKFILLKSNSIESTYREKRDENERKILEEFRDTTMKVIKVKDDLFNLFCELLKHVRIKLDNQKSRLRNWKKSLFRQTVSSVYDKNILGAIEERWALFIRTVESQPLETENDRESAKQKYFEELENKIKDIFESDKKDDYIKVIESPFYAISIGNNLVNNGKPLKAMQYFDYAIAIDEFFSAAAYVGKAWCLVEPETKFYYWNDQHSADYKNDAVKALTKGMTLLETEKAFLSAIHFYAVNRSDETELTKQLLEKSSILGNYMSSIETAIRKVKMTQRLVDVKFTVNEYHGRVMYNGIEVSEEHLQMERKCLDNQYNSDRYKIDLTFHDLTCLVDTTVKTDQAEKLVDSFIWESPLQLKLGEMEADLCSAFLSRDIDYRMIPKDRVLEMLSQKSNFLKLAIAKLPLAALVGKIVQFDCTIIKQGGIQESFKVLSEKAFKEKVANSDDSTFFTFKILDANAEVDKEIKDALFDVSLLKVSKKDALEVFQAFTGDVVLKIAGKTPNLIPILEGKKILIHDKKDHKIKTVQILEREYLGRINRDISCVEITICAKKAYELFSHKGSLNFSLDVSLKNVNLELTQKLLKLHHGIASLVIITKTKKLTKQMIPLLREKNVEFSVQFLNLNFTRANNLLTSECIGMEDVKKVSAKRLPSLYLQDHDPKEIHNFMARGIEYLLVLDEKGFVPWYSVASVCLLGSLQIALGGTLIATGLGATIGWALVTEGSVDLMVAYRAYSNRNFSWRDYAIQKSISLVISASTLGLSKIKDAGTGINQLIRGVGSEAAEQGAVQFILHGKEVATAAAKYGKSLYTLAFKQIGVSVAEAAARETLFQLSGTISNVVFQNLEENIESSISRSFKEISAQTPLLELLTRICVFEECIYSKRKHHVKQIVQNFLEEIVSPDNNFWKTQWNSIGMMVCQGVASSSSQALNNPIMLAGRLVTMLWGSVEIAAMEKNLCDQLVVKLQKYEKSSFSLLRVVELKCNFPSPGDDASVFANVVSPRIGSQVSLHEYIKSDDYKNLDNIQVSDFSTISDYDSIVPMAIRKFSEGVKKVVETLKSKTELDPFDNHSEILRSVVTAATQQIVHISQAHLITPVSTLAVGHFVRTVSNYVQATCIVSENENSDNQNKTIKRYDELITRLSKGETLNDNERTFIDEFKNSRTNFTVASQIFHNANDLQDAKNLQQIGRSLTISNVEEMDNAKSIKYSQSVKSEGRKAGISEIVHLSNVHNVNLVVTDNPQEVEQLAKQYQNRPILVYSQEKGFDLYNSSGKLVNISDKNGDQGYKILQHLTNKTENELRNRMAADILGHGKNLWVKMDAEQMLHRYGLGNREGSLSAQQRQGNFPNPKIPSITIPNISSIANQSNNSEEVPSIGHMGNANELNGNNNDNGHTTATPWKLVAIMMVLLLFALYIFGSTVLCIMLIIGVVTWHYFSPRNPNPNNDINR